MATTIPPRALITSCLANAIEWYDFAVYGAMASVPVEALLPPGTGAAASPRSSRSSRPRSSRGRSAPSSSGAAPTAWGGWSARGHGAADEWATAAIGLLPSWGPSVWRRRHPGPAPARAGILLRWPDQPVDPVPPRVRAARPLGTLAGWHTATSARRGVRYRGRGARRGGPDETALSMGLAAPVPAGPAPGRSASTSGSGSTRLRPSRR